MDNLSDNDAMRKFEDTLLRVQFPITFFMLEATGPVTRVGSDQSRHDKDKLVKLDSLMKLAIKGLPRLPWLWEHFWNLSFARRGNYGEALVLGDTMHIFRTNIEQIYGNCPSVDGAPLAEGDISELTDGTMYLALFKFYKKYGNVYKLCFGPKSFMVISDPVIMKHILQVNSKNFDKGVLAEILEPIMGNGLIPTDPKTSKIRRKSILPGFHKKWIERMVTLFGEQTAKAMKVIDQAAAAGTIVDVEERLSSLALDIIGQAVFNYDFNSISEESPVVKAAISTLKEAEHRSMFPLPYWKIPFVANVVPRQAEFKRNMALLDSHLQTAIEAAVTNRRDEDLQRFRNRDYMSMENPSMLQFLVDMSDSDVNSKQLRDDLMTMLIAGHETIASALTWAIFELTQQPELLARLQAEVDQYLPDADTLPTIEVLRDLKFTRLSCSHAS